MPNTYVGDTLMAHGTVVSEWEAGPVVPGRVSIGDGFRAATVRWIRSGQLAPNALVTVRARSALLLLDQNATVGGLTLEGGAIEKGRNVLT
ncbi:MAG: hypothetical protein RMN51_12675 [Verrucomicrobiota bacterium]|nr:hypothetical protein [Limisphaera sp.]MDW8382948.1 hypothetical protein [Verrucomicrobiota bacterium]